MKLRFISLVGLINAVLCCTGNAQNQKTAQLAIDAKASLGEGSIWDSRSGELLWLDIERSKLYIYNPALNKLVSKDLGQMPGTVVPAVNGSIILALKSGIFTFSRKDSVLRKMRPSPETDRPLNRFNDGKCDPEGRLWVGTMSVSQEPYKGRLYMFDLDGSFHVKIDSTSISNGIVWSSNHKKMYYIDTPCSCIKEYSFDELTGKIDSARLAIKIPTELGYPDGMTIDSRDKLWIAHWGGFGVYCWDPKSGELLDSIKVPAKNVTSCAFGGDKLDVLYITTARKGNSEEELIKYPLSGGLFKIKPGVYGVEAFYFGQKATK
jgi:sugar lactone lactonase YvrE